MQYKSIFLLNYYYTCKLNKTIFNYLCFSLLISRGASSSVVDRGFEPRNKIGICCFSAKHAALRRKCKD